MTPIESLFKESLFKQSSLKQPPFNKPRDGHEPDNYNFDIQECTQRVFNEMPHCFSQWLDPTLTGEPCLGPIHKVVIEFDASGYLYSSLYSIDNRCQVSEGACICLYQWNFAKVGEDDDFTLHRDLIAKFLAVCFEKALPKLCDTPEFLALPRETEVIFSVGVHSGWQQESLYVYQGEYHAIAWGNKRLKYLEYQTAKARIDNLHWQPYIDRVHNLDVDECASELCGVIRQALDWVSQNLSHPQMEFVIAWSSDWSKPTILATADEDDVMVWPGEFALFEWFDRNKAVNLDDIPELRTIVGFKIAQIACLAMEAIEDTNLLEKIPQQEGFSMCVYNRSSEEEPVFYPFDYVG